MTDLALNTAITNLASNTKNTIDEFRAILTELVNRSYKTGDVMMLSCSNAYIVDNFDGTGFGIADRVGWAICNGSNGTRNYNGKVPLAYGTDYLTMGATGGSKDAIVVAHVHGIKYGANGSGTKYPETPYISDIVGSDMQGTESTGVSGTDKNMQPYVVTLFIQKINV
jgi:hypothetical protein